VKSPRRAGLASPAAVLLAAVFTRLWGIEYTRFADDEATLLSSAAHVLATGQIPLTTGMSFTIGIRHPPLATLLVLPPALISSSPVLASAYWSLLDALAALFIYAAARAIGGRRAGLAAGLLYALEPAAVIYGRTLWNPDLVPLFAALALWGLVEFWRRGSRSAQAGALFAIGCAAQLHPQAAALLVVWLAVTAAKHRAGWPSAVAALGLLLVLSPYLYLQAGSGWSDAQAAVRFLAEPKQLDAQALAAMVALFSQHVYRELLLPRDTFLPAFSMDPLGWFYAAALATGLILTLARCRPLSLIAAGSFLAPLVAALNHSGGVAPHYLLALLPSGCVLAALALAAIPWPELGMGLLGLVIGWTAYVRVQFGLASPEQGTASNYGIPVRYSMEAAALAPSGETIYVSNRDQAAGVLGYLLKGRQKRFDGGHTFVLSRAPATYLADAGLDFAYGELKALAGEPRQIVVTPGGRAAYGLFELAHAEPPVSLPLDADVAHSIRLTGYQAGELRAGLPSSVRLLWQITEAHGPIPDDVRQFMHLVDASGTIWSTNADFRGYPRPYWQDGETVISDFALNPRPDTPTGGYWLETGFYEPISGRRLAQFQNGQPAGTAARIGPLKVYGRSPEATAEPPLAVFGNGEIALVSVRRSQGGVALRWQALRKPTRDYTVFVHVLDGQGQLVAQQDSPPHGGSYPTSLWDAGEVVEDVHDLSLAAGRQLEIGLYTFPDLRRLPVEGAGADRVLAPLPSS
jgi:hypothetical protein